MKDNMNFKDFLLKSHTDSRSEFRSYSSEEYSIFSVAFSSVPNLNGEIIRNFIFTQKSQNNSTTFTNTNFFISSKPAIELIGWVFVHFAKNPELYKSVYFDEFGVSNKHQFLLEQLSISNTSFQDNFFVERKRKFSDDEINYFFQTLANAINGNEQSLSETIDSSLFNFLVDEFQSSPRYRIVNHEIQKPLNLAHFETQYFKYMFDQIKFSQFLDDPIVREVILTSKLSLINDHQYTKDKKKI